MTLAQLRTALQTRGYATDTATQQTELLNAVYREIAGVRRWDWMEATTTAPCVVGTETVTPVATDILAVDALRILSGTSYYLLDYEPPQQFKERSYVDRDVGTPQYWTYSQGAYRLWPRPDKTYTVDIDYVKDPADLSADGDTPLLPATYHDLLIWGAVRDITFRERDWNGNNVATKRFEDLLARMTAAHGIRQRQDSQYVRRSDFWSTVGA